jgi:sulfopyruvate decarboxylase TPP-binding subunit
MMRPVEDELAERLAGAIEESGIDFMAYLPESRLGQIVPLLERRETIRMVQTAHENTAVSIACGAAFAGLQPAVYMEGTGLYVATWSLQTIAARSMLPMLLIASYVGSMQDRMNNYTFAGFGPRIPGLLDTLGVGYRVLEDGHELERKVVDAVRTALAAKLPVALLLTGEFTA